MKTYDDLSKEKKEKLQTFLHVKAISLNDFNHLSNISYLFLFMIFTGVLLVFVGVSNFASTGFLMQSINANETITQKVLEMSINMLHIDIAFIFVGLIGYLIIKGLAIYQYERDKKIDFLVFGYTSILDELEIKKSDINDLKKEWKKVKKNG